MRRLTTIHDLPPHRLRRFWRLIEAGVSVRRALQSVGITRSVLERWGGGGDAETLAFMMKIDELMEAEKFARRARVRLMRSL